MLKNKRTVEFTVNRNVYEDSHSVLSAHGTNLTHVLRGVTKDVANWPAYKRWLGRFTALMGVQLMEVALISIVIITHVRSNPRFLYVAGVVTYLFAKVVWMMWTVEHADPKHLKWWQFL